MIESIFIAKKANQMLFNQVVICLNIFKFSTPEIVCQMKELLLE